MGKVGTHTYPEDFVADRRFPVSTKSTEFSVGAMVNGFAENHSSGKQLDGTHAWRHAARLPMRPLHSHSKINVQRRSAATVIKPAAFLGGAADGPGRAPRVEDRPYEWPALLDQVDEPAFVHDGAQRILRCNAAYAAAAGLPQGLIIGKPYWQMFPASPSPPAPCALPGCGERAEQPGTFATEAGRHYTEHRFPTHCPAGNFWYCAHVLQDVTARKKLEDDLAREKALSDAVIETAPTAFFLVDQEGRLVRWNSYLRKRSGFTDEELQGRSILSLANDSEREVAQAKLLTAFATGYTRMELRVDCGEEEKSSYLLATGRRLMLNGAYYVAAFCTDITDRRRAERQLAEQKAFSDALIENIPGVFCVLDTEGNYLRWNSNLNRLTGLADDVLYRRSSLLSITEEDRPLAAQKLQEAFEHGYVKTVLHVMTAEMGQRAFLMTGRRFSVGGRPYMIGVGIDTTEQLATIESLEHETRTDGLTGLANRKHFLRRAEYELARCRRYGRPLTLWMMDLDNFKSVNDTHGHQAGDMVLRAFVETGGQALRDWDVMGRMGGEEFAVLLPETDAAQALAVAERLRQNFAHAEIPIGPGSTISVTVSIGVASVGEDDQDVHAVLSRADRALYEAKRTGRDKVCVA